jgi:hypothetical protein
MALILNPVLDKDRWNNFVSESPHGSVFCLTSFLDALSTDYDLWFVENGGQPQLGAIVLKDDQREPVAAPWPFTLYQGVLLQSSYVDRPSHTRIPRALEVTNFLLVELEHRYSRISFCLHPRFEDLRSFSWFHHDERHLGQFKVDLRYTAQLDLTSFSDFDEYIMETSYQRQRDYRRAREKGFVTQPSTEPDLLSQLHRLTFERQGITPDEMTTHLLASISRAALQQGFGQLLIAKDPTGAIASATLFLHDRQCGYYLVGANDPALRNTGAATYLMLENIRLYKENGLKVVDFVGINSPQRGYFKTSFNAAVVPYFVVTWEKAIQGSAKRVK